jgi:serine/threonine protein kinase
MKTLEKREMVERNKVLPQLHHFVLGRLLLHVHGVEVQFADLATTILQFGSVCPAQVMRVLTEERILGAVDHPFLARLYGTIQTDTHLHFLMQVCTGDTVHSGCCAPLTSRLVLFRLAHIAHSLPCHGWQRRCRCMDMRAPMQAVSASQYCGGGELYGLLMSQPNKRLQEAHMKFYVAEILLALQYLHLLGFVYRCFSVSPHAL